MKKFAKVSISLMVVFGIFISVNKLVFKDRVSIEDYKLRNTMYTTLRIDSYRDTEDGLVIKMKIKNSSNYTYRLDNASMIFFSCERDENGELGEMRQGFELNMMPSGGFDDENNIVWHGLGPKEEGYIEFLYPKGMKIDEDFFELDATRFKYNGKFTRNLSLGDSSYMTVGTEEKEDFMQRLDSEIGEKLRGE